MFTLMETTTSPVITPTPDVFSGDVGLSAGGEQMSGRIGDVARELAAGVLISLAVLAVLVGLIIHDRPTEPETTCVAFIHADMDRRAEIVASAVDVLRTSPTRLAVPSVEDLSTMCDAFPDLTVAEASERIVEGLPAAGN